MPVATEDLSDFQVQVLDFISVMFEPTDAPGEKKLAVVWKYPGRAKTMLCNELTDEILFPTRFSVVRHCLGETNPAWSLDAAEAIELEILLRIFYRADFEWRSSSSVVLCVRGGGVKRRVRLRGVRGSPGRPCSTR